MTVTDFDERREVPADRVLELARRGAAQLARVPPGPPWTSAPTPTGRNRPADDLTNVELWL